MGPPVILTDFAIQDLQDLVRYISLDNPDRARAFGNLLVDRALGVGKFPEIGRVLLEIGDPTLREIIHGPYRIVYRIRNEPKAIYVLRFWHAARGSPDIPRLET